MIIEIRPFKESDYEEICSWWRAHGEFSPLPGMMTEEGTFVLELDDEPVMTLSVLMTQSKEIAFFEGYCSKPGLDKEIRNSLGKMLWAYGYEFLKDRGYKRVIAYTDKDALAERYQNLGMRPNVSGLHSLGRVL